MDTFTQRILAETAEGVSPEGSRNTGGRGSVANNKAVLSVLVTSTGDYTVADIDEDEFEEYVESESEEAPRQARSAKSIEREREREKKLQRKADKEKTAEREKIRREWEKSQYSRYGFMDAGEVCTMCGKKVQENGGAICGRNTKKKAEQRGCAKGYCWKCMNKQRGEIKCTKSEFLDLGADAWWMHRGCMNADDLNAYYDGDVPKEQEKPVSFQWDD